MSTPYRGPYTGLQTDEALKISRGDATAVAPIKLSAGTRLAPALCFGVETGAGLYRAAASDIRLSVAGVDVACFGLSSSLAALGIGVVPAASFHVKRDGSGSNAVAIYENANPTDGNINSIQYQTTTTGAGAAANTPLAMLMFTAAVHDHATRSGTLTLSWLDAGTQKFFDASGDGVFARRSGPVEIKSAAGNGNVTLTPNGTGRVRINTDGLAATPAIAFTSETGSGIYRNGASDIRLAVAGSDFLVMNFVTASGSTSVPSLGIGTAPLRGGLHIKCPNTLLSGSGIQLENTDGTNGNATGLSMRCTTTGGGGAAMTEMAKVSCTFVDHANATRTSWLGFLWTDSTTPRVIRFTGNNIITSDTGPVTLASGSANGDVNLLPNGTGKIVLGLANQLRVTSGANQQAGDVVLVAGTVTVANTAVTANTKVIASRKVAGGALGFLTYTVSAGVSFTITSDSATDTSTVTYFLMEVS